MRIDNAGAIAERLGLPEEAVRDLQRRGYLLRLDLDHDEVRERLWLAYCAAAAASRGGPDLAESSPRLRVV